MNNRSAFSPSCSRTPPNADGLKLLRSSGIEAVWSHGSGFRDPAHGAFV